MIRDTKLFCDTSVKNKNVFYNLIIPIAFFLFFGLMWYLAPLGIYPDSGSYMSMQPGREPVYPLFLALFRRLFNEGDTLVWLAASGALDSPKAQELLIRWPSLHVATFVQSMLGAASCLYLARQVKLSFDIKGFLSPLLYLITLFPYVITPLASSSHMVLGRAVLTEGLAFPLFGFFAGALIRAMFTREGSFIKSLVLLLILVLTRNQMLLYLPVWALCCLISIFVLNRGILTNKSALNPLGRVKNIAAVIICCFVFIIAQKGINGIYTGLTRSGYQGASTGPYNMLTTLIYLGDEEAAGSIGDSDLKDLYLNMLKDSREGEINYLSAPKGLLAGAYHYEDSYDEISFGIQQPQMFEAARRAGAPEGEELDSVILMANDLRNSLFPVLAPRYIRNYFGNFLNGLTRSIASSGRIMGIYAGCVYFAALMISIYLILRGGKASSGFKAGVFLLTAIIMCLANSGATALVIMCLSRYMIYNTSIFYMAFLICLHELWQIMKENK